MMQIETMSRTFALPLIEPLTQQPDYKALVADRWRPVGANIHGASERLLTVEFHRGKTGLIRA